MVGILEVYEVMGMLVKDAQRILSSLNLPYSCNTILSILLLLQNHLTIKDLMNLTGYTKSTVATCLNILCRMYLVSRSRKDRSYVYKASVDLPDVLIEKQESLISNEIEPLCVNIEELMRRLSSDHEIAVRLKNLNTRLKALADNLRDALKSLRRDPSAN